MYLITILVALSFVIAFVHTTLFPDAPYRMSIRDLKAVRDNVGRSYGF